MVVLSVLNISSCIETPPPITHPFLQHETYTIIWGLWAERTQKICVLHIFTWECFTGVALDAPPAGEGRPAEPIGSFGGFHQKFVPWAISHHTLEVSFINDARMMLENLSLVSASSSWIKMFAGYYWNILAMYQMYDGRGELLIAEVS